MSNFGRPTAYKPEYCELAHNYCLLGATNEELAEFFDVTPRHHRQLDRQHSRIRDGRARGPRRCRCPGRALPVSPAPSATATRSSARSLHRGEERTISNVVHYPPDTQACIFWLRNRRRQSWREKLDTLGACRRRHGGAARGRRRERAQWHDGD